MTTIEKAQSALTAMDNFLLDHKLSGGVSAVSVECTTGVYARTTVTVTVPLNDGTDRNATVTIQGRD